MSEEGARGRAGIPNFSDEEINYLLYLIEANASLGLELWPLVASKYAKWSQAQAIYPRSLKSLKNKFDKIVNSRVTPGIFASRVNHIVKLIFFCSQTNC